MSKSMREKASVVAETIEKNNIDWVDEIEAFGNEIRLATIEECARVVENSISMGLMGCFVDDRLERTKDIRALSRPEDKP